MNAPHVTIPAALKAAPIDDRLNLDYHDGLPECPDCDCLLDLSQPDPGDDARPGNPDRLVGLCVSCGQSYVVTRSPDSGNHDWSNHLLERLLSRTAAPVSRDANGA